MSSRRYHLLRLYCINGTVLRRIKSQTVNPHVVSLSSVRYFSSKSDDDVGGGRRKSYIDSKLVQGRRKPLTSDNVNKNDTPLEKNMVNKRKGNGAPTLGPRASIKKLSAAEMYNVQSLRDALKVKNHQPLMSQHKKNGSPEPSASKATKSIVAEVPAEIATAAVIEESVAAPPASVVEPVVAAETAPAIAENAATEDPIVSANVSNNAVSEEQIKIIAEDMVKKIAHETAVPAMGSDLVSQVEAVGVAPTIPYSLQIMVENSIRTSEVETKTEESSNNVDWITAKPSDILVSAMNSSNRSSLLDHNVNASTASENGAWIWNFLSSKETSSPSTVIMNALNASTRTPIKRDFNVTQPAVDVSAQSASAPVTDTNGSWLWNFLSSNETGSPSKVVVSALNAAIRNPIDRDLSIAEPSRKIPPFIETPMSSFETMSPATFLMESLGNRSRPPPNRVIQSVQEPAPMSDPTPAAPSKETMSVAGILLDALSIESRAREIEFVVQAPATGKELVTGGAEPTLLRSTGQVADVVVSALKSTNRLMIERDLSANYEATVVACKELADATVAMPEFATENGEGGSLLKNLAESAETVSSSIGEFGDHGGLITEAFEKRAVALTNAVAQTKEAAQAKDDEKHEPIAGEDEAVNEIELTKVDEKDVNISKGNIKLAVPNLLEEMPPVPSMKDTWKALTLKNTGKNEEFPTHMTVAIGEAQVEAVLRKDATVETVALEEAPVEVAEEPAIMAESESAPVKVTVAEEATVEVAAVQEVHVDEVPVEAAAAEGAFIEDVSVDVATEAKVPAEDAAVVAAEEETSIEAAAIESVDVAAVEEAQIEVAAVEEEQVAATLKEASGEEVAREEGPMEAAAVDEALMEATDEVSLLEAAEAATAGEVSLETAVAEEMPAAAEDASMVAAAVEETPVEAALEEAPIEAAAVEEAAVMSTKAVGAEEAHIEQAAAEKASEENAVEVELYVEQVASEEVAHAEDAPLEVTATEGAPPEMLTTEEVPIELDAAVEAASVDVITTEESSVGEEVPELTVAAEEVSLVAEEVLIESDTIEEVSVEVGAAVKELPMGREAAKEVLVDAADLEEAAVEMASTEEVPVELAALEGASFEIPTSKVASVDTKETAAYDGPEVPCITPPDDVHIDEETNYWILMVRKIFEQFGLVEPLPPNPDGKYGGFPQPETQIVEIKDGPQVETKTKDDSNLPPPVTFTASEASKFMSGKK